MNISSLAAKHGFAAAYVLRPDKFNHYERRLEHGALHIGGTRLVVDVQADYPWATAILALIWPYSPYAEELPLCSNYPPAHAAYLASKEFLAALEEQGIRAARANVPVRELFMRSGLGIALKNGLTAMPAYGTRFTMQCLAIGLPDPQYDDAPPLGGCLDCGACQAICPVGAIDEEGFHPNRCLRAHMGKTAMPKRVMARMNKMLGCERCQYCCPHNAGQTFAKELPEAFMYERLLSDDVQEALALLGSNQQTGAKLKAHAAVMAAHENRRDLLPLIEAAQDDPRELVSAAVKFAISRLQNGKTVV